jgi:hypothetical protein
MADIIAIVDTGSQVNATVGPDNSLVLAGSNLSNPAIVQKIADIGDIDTTTLNHGAILIYTTTTNKWTSTTTLDGQNMEGGEF